MAKQTINVGTVPNDGTGDTLKTSFTKCNDNFTELYASDVASAQVPQHGRLTFVSTTALKFAPYAGDKIKINGAFYTIPTAGITGLANTGIFLNGTGSSSLGASTTYWVFAFDNGGTVTADFRSAATHATSATAGNVGVEILTGNDTRTLIGLCRTNSSSQFNDTAAARWVASWFNRKPTHLAGASTGDITTTSTSILELNTAARVQFVNWDAIEIHAVGWLYHGTAGVVTSWQCGVDGTSTPVFPMNLTAAQPTGGAYFQNLSASGSFNASEGYHYVTPCGWVGSGTGHHSMTLSGMLVI